MTNLRQGLLYYNINFSSFALARSALMEYFFEGIAFSKVIDTLTKIRRVTI